jgi:hypothetical protein
VQFTALQKALSSLGGVYRQAPTHAGAVTYPVQLSALNNDGCPVFRAPYAACGSAPAGQARRRLPDAEAASDPRRIALHPSRGWRSVRLPFLSASAASHV